MTCNVGGMDRVIRFVAGVVIIALGVYFKSWWGGLGAVLLLTAIFRFCPAYVPFHVSSAPKKPEAKS